jgi:hypothetical protein
MQSLRHDELLLAEYISALTKLQVHTAGTGCLAPGAGCMRRGR